MFTVSCHKCKKRYRLHDRLRAAVPPCPHCGLPMTLDEPSPRQPMRERLQAEMERLAAARSAANAAPPDAPKVRVAEGSRSPLAFGSRRLLLLIAAMAALVLCILGAGLWLSGHGRGQAAKEAESKVRAAVADAQRVDALGREADALAAWQIAYRQIILYQQSPRDFQAELSLATRRIGELQDSVRRAAAQKAAAAPQPKPAAEPAPQAATALRPPPAQPAAPPAPAAAASAPPTLAQVVAAVRQGSIRGDPVVVLDAPGDFQRWQPESWGDPVRVSLEGNEADGSRFVVLQQADGKAGKWVVSMDQPLDLTQYDSLTLEMRTEEPVTMAIAARTQSPSAAFESKTQSVPKADLVAVSFALKGKLFKSDLTNWQFGTEIKNPANVVTASVFIYSRSKTPIRFRNVCLRKAVP